MAPKARPKAHEEAQKEAQKEVREVAISREPVELYKILKFEALVNSGGEAKAAIAEGHVQLNGAVETRKRKKIVSGDCIEFNGERMQITLQVEPNP